MSFGFPPKYSQLFPLEELSTQQFVVIAMEGVKALGWNIGKRFPEGFFAYTRHSVMGSYGEELHIIVDNGIAEISSESTGSQLFDLGKNRIIVGKFIQAFYEQKNQCSAEMLEDKVEQLRNTVIWDMNSPSHSQPTRTGISGIFSLFRPVRNYFMTPLLIDLNCLFFLVMLISGVNGWLPDNESLINWGANFGPITLEGQSWRLFTNIFLHIGIFHLLFNMYALLYIGLLLEPRLGTLRFAAAYFLTGLCSSMTSLFWHPLVISAGASGAIFGMYGVFLAMLTTNLIEKSARKALFTSIGVFVGYNLLNGMKGGIDNAAHIGGLVSGLLIGYAFYPGLKQNQTGKLKYLLIGCLSFFMVVGSIILYHNIPNDVGKYDEKMKRFGILEGMALELYKMPQNSPRSKILYEIKDRGLYYWNECLILIQDADQLKLPDQLHKRNKTLIGYCQLRIKSYELLYTAVDENSSQYGEQIQSYNRQIESMIDSLSEKPQIK